MKEAGLTEEEAKKELKRFGSNEIKDISKISIPKIILGQIKGNMIFYLLVVAMIISFFVGEVITAYTILAVIVIIVVVGFVQEYKAEKVIESLKSMLMPVSIVVRDGREKEIQIG